MSKYPFNPYDEFIITVGKSKELLADTVLVPTTIKLDRPSSFEFKTKTRVYYYFENIKYRNNIFATSIFEFNNFLSYLKSFVGNRLNSKKKYYENLHSNIYTLEVINYKNPEDEINDVSLRICFNDYDKVILDKVETEKLLANLLQIKYKIEIDMISDTYHPFNIGEI